MLARVVPYGRKRARGVGVESSLVCSKEEEIGGDAVLVAKGRVGHPVASDVAELDLAEGDLGVRAPERLELGRGEEELCMPGHMPAQGVHEERGEGVLLQAIPEAAEGVAG